jgi:hypothetical protein
MIIQERLSRTSALALYSLCHPFSLAKFSAKSLLTPMQERVKGPKPEYQWIGEANSIRLGKYLPCPPVLPRDVSILRRCSRGIGGTLHTISLPFAWVSVESIIFLLLVFTGA